MFTLLIVLIALIGVFLTLAVLLQSGKGGGLAGIASGGATTQILGARQAPDFLEKATWTLATAFIVLCVMTNFFIDTGSTRESVIQQQVQEGATQQVLPPPATTPQPAAPAPGEGSGEGGSDTDG